MRSRITTTGHHRSVVRAVLQEGAPAGPLHVFAHCLRGNAGGVAVLVVNTDKSAAQSLEVPVASERYTLTGQDARVSLNGRELKLGAGDAMPQVNGARVAA